jgi:hypothetical protein
MDWKDIATFFLGFITIVGGIFFLHLFPWFTSFRLILARKRIQCLCY